MYFQIYDLTSEPTLPGSWPRLPMSHKKQLWLVFNDSWIPSRFQPPLFKPNLAWFFPVTSSWVSSPSSLRRTLLLDCLDDFGLYPRTSWSGTLGPWPAAQVLVCLRAEFQVLVFLRTTVGRTITIRMCFVVSVT